MKFRISPNQYQIIGDKHVTDQITSMNDENPYDENTPTEPNPDRKSLIDREELNELYDGEYPYDHISEAHEEASGDDTVLQGGEIVEGESTHTDDSNDGGTNGC